MRQRWQQSVAIFIMQHGAYVRTQCGRRDRIDFTDCRKVTEMLWFLWTMCERMCSGILSIKSIPVFRARSNTTVAAVSHFETLSSIGAIHLTKIVTSHLIATTHRTWRTRRKKKCRFKCPAVNLFADEFENLFDKYRWHTMCNKSRSSTTCDALFDCHPFDIRSTFDH